MVVGCGLECFRALKLSPDCLHKLGEVSQDVQRACTDFPMLNVWQPRCCNQTVSAVACQYSQKYLHAPNLMPCWACRPASGTGSEASAELIEDLQNENLRLNTEIARLQEELKVRPLFQLTLNVQHNLATGPTLRSMR